MNYNNRVNYNNKFLTQSKSVTNCFSSAKNISNTVNFENINAKENQQNKSSTIEKSQINENINNNNTFINSKENNISFYSPINFAKNKTKINFNSDENLKVNSHIRNRQKNISPIGTSVLTNSNKLTNNLSNLINYSTLLSNMSIIKRKKFNIKIDTNTNIKKNTEEQKETNCNYKRPHNKVSLIKNTKKNINKLQQMFKNTNTPRMNKVPTKLEYKDNITYSNYVYNSKFCEKKKIRNKSEYINSFGNILTNVKRQNSIIKESPSLQSCINLKKNPKNINKKNITYRSNSSFNILKKAS